MKNTSPIMDAKSQPHGSNQSQSPQQPAGMETLGQVLVVIIWLVGAVKVTGIALRFWKTLIIILALFTALSLIVVIVEKVFGISIPKDSPALVPQSPSDTLSETDTNESPGRVPCEHANTLTDIKTYNTFTCFQRLPAELRLRVWKVLSLSFFLAVQCARISWIRDSTDFLSLARVAELWPTRDQNSSTIQRRLPTTPWQHS